MKLLILILLYGISFIELTEIDKFKNELCSFNGVFKWIEKEKATYNCSCNVDYATDTKNIKKFDGKHDILCSYERKRKFIAVFFSIFLPFGFDYFYLGYYYWFVAILLFTMITYIGNFLRFAVANAADWSYFKDKYNLIFFIMLILNLIFWVVNVFMIATDVIKDSNGIATVDDLDYFFNLTSD
jgi:hypothetical protein